MRSLLEKAIVHLLNEDNDAATALFHQFMVERARQIHNSLRQGDEVALSEGWDDEISKEEYFADDDLDDLVDDDEATDDGESSPISGNQDDEDYNEDEFSENSEEEEGVEERLDDIEDQLSELTREFEQMMAELDGDETEMNNDAEDVDADTADIDADTEDMDTDTEDMDADTEMDTDTGDMDDAKSMKDEDEMMEDDDENLDDITESVIAELEKVLVGDMHADGEEVGDGKKITQNQKSALTMKKAEADDATAKTLFAKQKQNDSFELETPPVKAVPVKLKSRNKVNDRTGKPSDLKSVPKGGDPSAMLNKDFAGIKKPNTKSTID